MAFQRFLAVSAAVSSILSAEAVRASTLDEIQPVTFVEDTGAAIRIEAGDELRIVSQEIPAAACHLHNGVAAALAADLLDEGIQKFERMFAALRDGDPAFGIMGGEADPKLIRLMDDLHTDWEVYGAAARQVLANPEDQSALNILYRDATMMLDKSYLLLSEIEAKYSNPVELLYADAMLLEVSGRQAMLSQRIAYLACRKWSGASDDAYIAHLRLATDQYNFAMRALSNGAPELGINPPPTEEIATALGAIEADSNLIAEKLADLFETGMLDTAKSADLYAILSDKMHKLENIAHLYALYSKRVY